MPVCQGFAVIHSIGIGTGDTKSVWRIIHSNGDLILTAGEGKIGNGYQIKILIVPEAAKANQTQNQQRDYEGEETFSSALIFGILE